MRAVAAALVVACVTLRGQEPPAWPSLDGLPVLTAKNAGGLQLVGQLGAPLVEELQWSGDGRHLGLRSADGIRVHAVDPQKSTRLIRGRVLRGEHMPVGFCFARGEDAVLTCDGSRRIAHWDIRSGWPKDGVADAGAGVRAIATSPTETLLAAVTDDGKLRLWRGEAFPGQPRLLEDHTGGASGLSIDPKGQYAATWAGWNDVKVWNLASGDLAASITTRTPTSSGILSPAHIAPDGALWANGPGETFRWQLPAGEALSKPPFLAYLGPGCFHPDGLKGLTYTTDRSLAIVTLASGKPVGKPIDRRGRVAAAFEPTKGRVVAVSSEGKLALYGASSGVLASSESTGAPLRVLGFSMAQMSAICESTADDLCLVDLHKGTKGPTLKLGQDTHPHSVLWHEPTQLAITFAYSVQRRKTDTAAWRLSGSRLKRLPLLDGVPGDFRSLACDPRGELLALGSGSDQPLQVRLMPIKTAKVRATISLPNSQDKQNGIIGLDFDPAGKRLAVSTRSSLLLIDVDQGKIAFKLRLPEDFTSWLRPVRFSTDGSLLAVAAYKDEVLVYELGKRELKARLKVEGILQDDVAISPGGDLLACSVEKRAGWQSTSEIALLEIESGETLARFSAHSQDLSELEFVPKGNAVVSSSGDGSIRLWGVAEKKPGEDSAHE